MQERGRKGGAKAEESRHGIRAVLRESELLTAREAWARFNGASIADRDHARAVFDAVLRRVGKVPA